MKPIDLETDVGQDITQPRVAAAEARATSATEVSGEEIEADDEVTIDEVELEDAGQGSENSEQDEEA